MRDCVGFMPYRLPAALKTARLFNSPRMIGELAPVQQAEYPDGDDADASPHTSTKSPGFQVPSKAGASGP
jgi:hypothetical protein